MQTKSTIRSLLTAAGLRPNKRFGQNFLIDGNLMRKLIDAAEIAPDDVVLEVGAGTGSLTEELTQRAGAVVTVEIDDRLIDLLRSRLAECTNVTLLHQDVLASKHALSDEVVREMLSARGRLGGRMLLVANLPYQVATPLIIDLLVGPLGLARLCFTVQKEVGERLTAEPGGREYGPVSVITQALATIRKIAAVPPQAFWPAPSIDSVMLHVDPMPFHAREIESSEDLASLVRAGFAHRRKTLAYNLGRMMDKTHVTRSLVEADIEGSLRPERLAVADWVRLAKAVGKVRGE